MIIIFGKGKVWKSIESFLLQNNKKDFILMDDSDYSDFLLKKSEIIIVSPWISKEHKIFSKYKNKIFSELNFLWKFFWEKLKNIIFIWITWTNWKSTTSHITYSLLKKLLDNKKFNIFLSWNFWEPLSKTLLKIENSDTNIIILEVSSFMLYNLKYFSFDYSILTNIELDHIDWHWDFDDYKNSKLNIVKHTKKTSICFFETKKHINNIFSNKIIYYKPEYDIKKTLFLWKHNKANLQWVFLLTQELLKKLWLVISNEEIKKNINTVKPLEHRLQLIKIVDWIKIYDDWICTSTHAQKFAINSFDEKVLLIAGWYDKWDNYEINKKIYEEKVRFWIFIWQTSKIYAKIFSEIWIKFKIFDNFEKSIISSIKIAKKEWIKNILFSPWCASFWMFKNVYERVKMFSEIIKKL